MKKLMFGLLACSLAFVIGCGGSTTSGTSGGGGGGASNADKIVGTWTMVKKDGKEMPKEAGDMTMEFTKDNKAKMSMNGKVVEEGTYKINGDKLTMAQPNDPKDKPETSTIKTLTADTLVIVDTKGEGKDKKSMEIEMKKQK